MTEIKGRVVALPTFSNLGQTGLFTTWVVPPAEVAQREANRWKINAYGQVVYLKENGEQQSIICGHGGSMWYCLPCAEAALEGQARRDQLETGIERYFREHP